MEVKNSDRLFIEKYFSGLYFHSQNEKLFLKGVLSFAAGYDKNKKKYTLHDPSRNVSGENIIKDSYEVEVDLSDNVNSYREVKETGGRIIQIAKEKEKLLVDLHAYRDGKVCVAGYLDEDESISLKDFLGSVIVPFFYDQSWYAKHGEWPRGSYAHSFLGLLENYHARINDISEKDLDARHLLTTRCIETMKSLAVSNPENGASCTRLQKFFKNSKLFRKKKSSRNGQCLCGSHKYFPICHPDAFSGFLVFRNNVREFNLENMLYEF